MGTTVEDIRSRVGRWLRATTAAPSLPVFSIQLCWPLPASAGARTGRVRPLVATVQFSLGRRPLAEAASVAPGRRRLRPGSEAVRQLQALLASARREADREFARALLAHRCNPVARHVPAQAEAGTPQRSLRRPAKGPVSRRPGQEAPGLQAWMLLCLRRADGVARRWSPQHPGRRRALAAARGARPEL